MRQALYDASGACPERLRMEILSNPENDEVEDEDEEDKEEEDDGGDDTNRRSATATAWVKNFFDCESNPNHRICLLPPEPTKSGRAHKPIISKKGRNTAIKQHLKSSHHRQALLHDKDLVEKRGMEPSIAALDTNNEMKRRQGRKGLKFANGKSEQRYNLIISNFTVLILAAGDVSCPAAKVNLRRELTLLCWNLKKGISFSATDDPLFREYHSISSWKQPPSRRRLGVSLLNTLYFIISKRIKKKLEQADYFSVTSDAWTSKVL